LDKFAPYGEGNQEPLFLFENIKISNIEKFWKVWVGHMKIYGERGDNLIQVVFWKKGDECDKVICDTISVIWRIQEDTFNKGYYIVGEELIEKEEE
jgi:single-stranded DNA-specific DHH superfamily exonuclease